MKNNHHIVLTLTPKRNVEGGKLIDPDLVKTEIFGWDQPIKVYNWCTLLSETVKANKIDVDDHYIPLNNQDWKILTMVDGPIEVNGPEGNYIKNVGSKLGYVI